jgi:Cytochrome c oxidase subunit IV
VKTALRYLWALSIFGLALGTFYYVLTAEWVGSVLLWFMGLMPLIVAAWATTRGMAHEPLECDDGDADPGQGAGGSLGSFPLASAWPAFIVSGVVLIGAALIYGLILLPAGVALMGWAVVGFMAESRG